MHRASDGVEGDHPEAKFGCQHDNKATGHLLDRVYWREDGNIGVHAIGCLVEWGAWRSRMGMRAVKE